MSLKIRYRAPSGPGTLDLASDATVAQLFDAIRQATNTARVAVKYGWPPRALDLDSQADASVASLNLHRESLTVVPTETAAAPGPALSAAQQAAPVPSVPAGASFEQKDVKDGPVTVKMAQTDTYLVLRVMPDDNSCMFTAIAGALRGANSGLDGSSPEKLRRMVADHILAKPDIYTKVVLEKEPRAYCDNILRPDVWGGAIELGIISEVFSIEICVVNVKEGTIIKYGEDQYDLRCVLVWSNIHYDRVAEIFTEDQVDDSFDVTTWNCRGSDHILQSAKDLCRKLKDEYHYFTDTSDFVVRCNQCGWIGQGERAVVVHSTKTGHVAIEEIPDTN
ncbi:ubiquitin-specific protease otu1 [Pestalotiopsis sp. 9143b]|nr:ubiquitin-specific protease otu1 [Pestalotiopsis sp. 9143b]